MSDTPETLAAILAEMHAELDCIDDTNVIPVVYIKNRLPRIEAAAERERNAHTNDIHDALYKATGIPGNAAALREALESIGDDCRVLDRKDMWEEEGECYYDALRDIREKVNTALAAPPRNCDRFATADEAVAAFADHLRAWENAHGIFSECPDHPVKVPAGAFAWLFDAAEGGDHA